MGRSGRNCKISGYKRGGEFVGKLFLALLGGYHVFAQDQKNYNYALVSGPSYDYLWMLARQPKLDSKINNLLLKKARLSGFGVENLIEVDHTKPNCKRKNTYW